MGKAVTVTLFGIISAMCPIMADVVHKTDEAHKDRGFSRTYYYFDVNAMENCICSLKNMVRSLNKDSKEFPKQVERINRELEFLEFCITSTSH